MTTLSERISQSAFDGSRLRVVLLLDLHDGAQKQFLEAYERHAQPGRVRPRTHQRPAVPVDREPLAVAHHQRVGERAALPRLGQQRGARRDGPAAAQLRTRHPLAALQRPARDRQRLRRSCPSRPRAACRPRPGWATVWSATRSPSPSSRAPRRSSRRSSPTTTPRRPGSTSTPGCAAPRCSCTATASCGRSRSRATSSRRCATSPGSPRSGPSRKPSTRTWSRTGTSTDPDSARMFFTRAALPAVHHVTSGPARPRRASGGTRSSTRPRRAAAWRWPGCSPSRTRRPPTTRRARSTAAPSSSATTSSSGSSTCAARSTPSPPRRSASTAPARRPGSDASSTATPTAVAHERPGDRRASSRTPR